jgi:hypothetical protein
MRPKTPPRDAREPSLIAGSGHIERAWRGELRGGQNRRSAHTPVFPEPPVGGAGTEVCQELPGGSGAEGRPSSSPVSDVS